MKRLILYLFLSVLNIYVFSQEPSCFRIGEDELNNVNVYSLIYNDFNNLLFTATNNGLFLYKQNQFLKLKGPKKIQEDSFFELTKNSNHEVFCKSLNGKVFKINPHNNTYDLYYDASKVVDYVKGFWFFFNDKNELILIGQKAIWRISKSGKIISKIAFEKVLQSNLSFCKQTPEGVYLSFLNANGEENSIYFLGNDELVLYQKVPVHKAKDALKSYRGFKYFNVYKQGLFGIDYNGNLSTVNNNFIKKFRANELERFGSVNDTLFIGLGSQRGCRFFQIKDSIITASEILFPETFISAFDQNKSQIQFFGTFGEGIIIVPNPDIIKKKEDYVFSGIACSPNNEVAISCRSGELFRLKNNNLELYDKSPSNIDDVWYLGQNEGGEAAFYYNNSKNKIVGIKSIKRINNYLFLIRNYRRIELVDIINGDTSCLQNFFKTGKKKIISEKKIFTSFDLNLLDSTFYYGTNEGLFKKYWGDEASTLIRYRGERFRVNNLLFYQNQFICATDKRGLLFCLGDSIINQIDNNDGLLSNKVYKVKEQNNYLYILTNKGFQVYDLIKKIFIPIGWPEGIDNKEIIDFDLSLDKIWLLEKHSYYKVDLLTLLNRKNNDTSGVYLDSIIVNGKLQDYVSKKSYNYKENQFEFYFDYRGIVNKQEVDIYYFLDGFYKDWKKKSVFENKIEFQSLPPGSYRFKLKSVFRGRETQPFQYSFIIYPPFWQSWWFYVLVGVLSISIVTVYFNQRIKKIKQEDQVKLEQQKLLTESIDAKLKALRSQMNPHFIFNSLNSIQALILEQETEKSYDYVVMFAELVRKALIHSDNDFIAIEEELNFLETYLNIESLRFKNEFDYQINYKGDKNLTIPSLLIQPFVENAIFHGLLHKKGDKKIDVLFEFKQELTCTIIDNGIGREKAKEIKARQQNNHKSFSLNATKQRMKIITQQYGKYYGYEFIDLFTNNEPNGTKVIIKLPFKYRY